jgi:hypothetical protein
MLIPKFIRLHCATLLLLLGTGIASTAAAFDTNHTALAEVLRTRVTNSFVRYADLKAAPARLDAYLAGTAQVTKPEFEKWSEADQISFLVNVYNAATLKLITDNYPVKSIKKIGGWFGSPWKQEVVRLFGKTITLDELEHGMLRANYREPRVHFALVCAAKGCPPLREEPFIGARLNEQLDDQGRRFLAQPEKNRFENGVLYLSPIFNWFAADFTATKPSVAEFVRPFLPEAQRKAMGTATPTVKFTDYDWSLNDASGK